MRYGRSRLPEIILVTVFGIGGGFYAFQPAFKQYQVDHERTSSGKLEEGQTAPVGK